MSQKKAYLINRDGAANVASAAAMLGCRMIHVSTDYVFDGSGTQPLDERSRVNPLNVYGKSKLAGELEVARILEGKALILRTSWLHGKHGTNFVATMIKLFGELESLKVVNDQIGSPTWVGWLAEVILDLGRTQANGIVHAANAGSTSWFDFANTIYDLVSPKLPNLKVKEILPQTSEQMERPAKRPKFSVLDCSKLRSILGRDLMAWQDGVKGHLSDLGILEAV